MNIKFLIPLSAALLCGCTTILTNTIEVEPGVYDIIAHKNIFNTKDTMLGKALEKAEKVCGNANFKQIGGPTLDNTSIYLTTINGSMDSSSITIRVDCNVEQ